MEKITVYINNGIPNSQTLLKVPPTLYSFCPAFVWSFFFLCISPSFSLQHAEALSHFGVKEAEPSAANVMTYLWLQHLHVNAPLFNKPCRLNISVCGSRSSRGSNRWQENGKRSPSSVLSKVFIVTSVTLLKGKREEHDTQSPRCSHELCPKPLTSVSLLNCSKLQCISLLCGPLMSSDVPKLCTAVLHLPEMFSLLHLL